MSKRPSALDSLVSEGHIDKLKEEQKRNRETSKRSSVHILEQEPPISSEPEELIESIVNSDVIYHLDASEIRPWAFADRPDSELVNIQELADDISENGQNSPILVRKLPTSVGQIKYEFIFGNRRISACRLLGIKVNAVVKSFDELPNNKAFALMFGENEQREGISSWARSISFKNILSQGIFKSKRELSRAIGKNEGYIKDLSIYQRIPEDVSKAIGSLTNVSQLAAKEIVSLGKDQNNLSTLIEMADLIQTGASPALIRKKVLNRSTRKTSPKTYSGKGGEYFAILSSDSGLNIKFKRSLPKEVDPDRVAKLLIDLVDN